MTTPATVAADGALHTTGLPAGFARVLHVAVCAVPLLTLLVRPLEPQHWGIGSGGWASPSEGSGNVMRTTSKRKSVARHGYRD